jgi:ABC-type tungstate transport system, periplasmic component
MNLITTFFTEYNDIVPVVLMSLFISIMSTAIASILGLISGMWVALHDFKLKRGLIRVTDTLMSLPPVLMGLLVYLLLSRKGPLGDFQLLFTPAAMIIAQCLLVLPIIFGLSVSSISKSGLEVKGTCISLGAGKVDTFITVIKESRNQILSVITAGFGRAISEVGAVMMVGGNIKGYTRVMTTYIALETGKGNFNQAIVIGFILLFVSFLINSILHFFQGRDA